LGGLTQGFLFLALIFFPKLKIKKLEHGNELRRMVVVVSSCLQPSSKLVARHKSFIHSERENGGSIEEFE
jgi:hypothetical protein